MTIEYKNFNPNQVPTALDGQMITYEAECFSCDGIYMEDGTPIPPPLRIAGFEEYLPIKKMEKLCKEHDREWGWSEFIQKIAPGEHDIQIKQFNFPIIRHHLHGSNN